ncbi:MAG: prolyl oligopeptidase family serine peptidase [Pseudomonadota bacterium]
MADALPPPPIHRKTPRTIEKFGLKRHDEYAWMKPRDWHAVLENPETLESDIRRVINRENAYTKDVLSASEDLIIELRQHLLSIASKSTPETEVAVGEYTYFQRLSVDGERVIGRRQTGSGAEEILLDMASERQWNPAAKLSWGGPKYNFERTRLGWAVDTTGSGLFSVNVRDVDSGRLIVDDIHDGHGEFAFDRSGQFLFWVGRDDRGRANSVWRRDIRDGTDVKCFETDNTSYFIDLQSSRSGAFVFIRRLNGDQSETLFIPCADPRRAPTMIEPMSNLHDYDVEHWREQFIIRTNAEGAEDFSLVATPVATPGRAHWRSFCSHVAGRPITRVTPFKQALVRTEWRDAKPHLVIMAPDQPDRDVHFEDAAYSLDILSDQNFEAETIAFRFSSPIRPPVIMTAPLVVDSAPQPLEVPQSDRFDSARYNLRRLNIHASDGAEIPVTLLHKRSNAPNPDQPLYLSAYGAYGEMMEASFRPEAIALADRGWTCGIAHVRGGGERGADWWRPTLKHGKSLTFSDFVECTEGLISTNLAGAKNIVAHGTSAGGMLMGSVFATHPQLWAGIIAQVPFVDILNTLDDWQNHPLGSTPFAIWGDPRVEEEYRAMASYSPYEALKPAHFPMFLATGGVKDDRVAFWEPLKFSAKARDLNLGEAPILTHIDLNAGHLGDPSPEGQLRQSAMFLAFAIQAVRHQRECV